MLVKRIVYGIVTIAGLALPAPALADALGAEQSLGQRLFFDAGLSVNGTQSCGSCHALSAFFTDPTHAATSLGAIAGLAGFRNAPTVLYSAFTPSLHYDAGAESQVGGQFLDGRVNTLEQQAAQPFLNPVEMAMPDKASVIQKLKTGPNATEFRQVFGATSLDNVDQAYNLLTQAIATYERSPALSPFTSKYDAWAHGLASMTPRELAGMKVYDDPGKGNCAACHPDTTPSGSRIGAMFTDRTYDDIGVPKNPANPQYTLPSDINPDGADFIDIGLGGTTGDSGDDVAFKVPTLRDIDETGPYMHNGYFTTLDQVIDFYNTRRQTGMRQRDDVGRRRRIAGMLARAGRPRQREHGGIGQPRLVRGRHRQSQGVSRYADRWLLPRPRRPRRARTPGMVADAYRIRRHGHGPRLATVAFQSDRRLNAGAAEFRPQPAFSNRASAETPDAASRAAVHRPPAYGRAPRSALDDALPPHCC
jgi:cytochrome c peroxidase